MGCLNPRLISPLLPRSRDASSNTGYLESTIGVCHWIMTLLLEMFCRKGTEVFVWHKQGCLEVLARQHLCCSARTRLPPAGDRSSLSPICFQYGGHLDVILTNNASAATPSTDPIEPAATAADQTPPRLAREALLGR